MNKFIYYSIACLSGNFAQHIDFNIHCSLTNPTYNIVNDNHKIDKKSAGGHPVYKFP